MICPTCSGYGFWCPDCHEGIHDCLCMYKTIDTQCPSCHALGRVGTPTPDEFDCDPDLTLPIKHRGTRATRA